MTKKSKERLLQALSLLNVAVSLSASFAATYVIVHFVSKYW